MKHNTKYHKHGTLKMYRYGCRCRKCKDVYIRWRKECIKNRLEGSTLERLSNPLKNWWNKQDEKFKRDAIITSPILLTFLIIELDICFFW